MSFVLTALMLLSIILVCGWLLYASMEMDNLYHGDEPESSCDAEWNLYAEHTDRDSIVKGE